MLTVLALLFAGPVADLAHPDCRRRETATATLRRAGWLAWPALARAANSPDPERGRRASDLLDRLMRPLGEEAQLARILLQPLGDCTEAEAAFLATGFRADRFAALAQSFGLCDLGTEYTPLDARMWGGEEDYPGMVRRFVDRVRARRPGAELSIPQQMPEK